MVVGDAEVEVVEAFDDGPEECYAGEAEVEEVV